jgi:hypothetical protein
MARISISWRVFEGQRHGGIYHPDMEITEKGDESETSTSAVRAELLIPRVSLRLGDESSICFQHLFSVLQRGIRELRAAQHARDLGFAVFCIKLADGGPRSAA